MSDSNIINVNSLDILKDYYNCNLFSEYESISKKDMIASESSLPLNIFKIDDAKIKKDNVQKIDDNNERGRSRSGISRKIRKISEEPKMRHDGYRIRSRSRSRSQKNKYKQGANEHIVGKEKYKIGIKHLSPYYSRGGGGTSLRDRNRIYKLLRLNYSDELSDIGKSSREEAIYKFDRERDELIQTINSLTLDNIQLKCRWCPAPISGVYYTCTECKGYFLCESCEQNIVHSHYLMKKETSITVNRNNINISVNNDSNHNYYL